MAEISEDTVYAYLADISDVLALLNLELVVQLVPVVRHCIHAVSSRESLPQRVLVIDVALRFSSARAS